MRFLSCGLDFADFSVLCTTSCCFGIDYSFASVNVLLGIILHTSYYILLSIWFKCWYDEENYSWIWHYVAFRNLLWGCMASLFECAIHLILICMRPHWFVIAQLLNVISQLAAYQQVATLPILGPDSIKRCTLTSIGNPIVEIRRS